MKQKSKLPRLKTQRLLLRLPQPKDAKKIVEYFLSNKGHFAATDSNRPKGFYTLAYWKKQIPKIENEFKREQAIRFLLFHSENTRLIGTMNFTQIYRGPFQACYLGYGIAKDEQGKGLMTEALHAGIEYVFKDLNLHRIMANYLPENSRSARVLNKLGFVVEGHAQKYLLINGEWREHVLTSLTNEYWRAE